tara:strand:- start:78 stop:686 length:609 start_codon:yes stop_codon:yes gene_type:complete
MELEFTKDPITTVEDVALYKQVYRIQQLFDMEEQLYETLLAVDEAILDDTAIDDYDTCTIYRRSLQKVLLLIEQSMRNTPNLKIDYWNEYPLGKLDVPKDVKSLNIDKDQIELKGLKCLMDLPLTIDYTVEEEIVLIGRGVDVKTQIKQIQMPWDALWKAHRAILEFYAEVGLDLHLKIERDGIHRADVVWKRRKEQEQQKR